MADPRGLTMKPVSPMERASVSDTFGNVPSSLRPFSGYRGVTTGHCPAWSHNCEECRTQSGRAPTPESDVAMPRIPVM